MLKSGQDTFQHMLTTERDGYTFYSYSHMTDKQTEASMRGTVGATWSLDELYIVYLLSVLCKKHSFIQNNLYWQVFATWE